MGPGVGLKRQQCEVDYSLPFGVEIKNECSCTCGPCRGVRAQDKDKFSFFSTSYICRRWTSKTHISSKLISSTELI